MAGIIYWLWVALLALLVYGLNIRERFKHRGMPGPLHVPILGNIFQLGGCTKTYLTWQHWSQKYGPLYVWYLGRHAFINISDPVLIREIGLKKFMSYHDRADPIVVPGSGEDMIFSASGMLLAKGKYWAGLRGTCEHLFHKKALSSYDKVINEASNRLTLLLDESCISGVSVNVNDLMARMTINVIGEAAFGVDFNALTPEEEQTVSELLTAAHTIFKPFDASGPGRIIPILCFTIPHLTDFWIGLASLLGSTRVANMIYSRRFLWGLGDQLLKNARKTSNEGRSSKKVASSSQKANSTAATATAADITFIPPKSFAVPFQRATTMYSNIIPDETSILHRLRHAVNHASGQPLTDIDICAQTFTLLLAGYETSSLAISFALYELSQDHDIQKRVQKELDGLVSSADFKGGSEEEPFFALEDLPRMPLTEAVFYEALRKWPPVTPIFALNRHCTRDGTLGGYRIHKGDNIMIDVYSVHRNPKYWPDPEVFRPERFLPGSPEAENLHSDAFLPFGIGPRKCLGEKLALQEGVIGLARILQRYNFVLDKQKHQGPLVLETHITVVPVDGIWIKFEKR